MKTVLILSPYFLPGHNGGGPIRSIHGIVELLREYFDFRIITSDRDLGDRSPYRDVHPDQWSDAYGARVKYCSPSNLNFKALHQAIRDTPHDLLYLNSFFSPRFTIAPLVARRLGYISKVPVIIAPRGEFSPGALAFKSMKKRVYINFARLSGMLKDIQWHASSSHELEHIRSALAVDSRRISVASNLSVMPPRPDPIHIMRTPGQPLRVLFLSRITPKKNLDFALKVIQGITFPLTLTIAGPEEDATYTSHCRNIAARLPSNITVAWSGSLPVAEVSRVMASHDIFFLPTLGENFGHVILESLSAGTPVLVSDLTPWRDLDGAGVGYDIPLSSIDSFRTALFSAWLKTDSDVLETRRRAREYASRYLMGTENIEATRAMFARALAATRSSND